MNFFIKGKYNMIELRQERTSDYRSSDDEFAVRSYFRAG